MSLPPVTYVTMNSLSEGVGSSQVLAYVERLAGRGIEMVLHTFEKEAPPGSVRTRIDSAGITWVPHRFGPGGARGAALRVATAAHALRRAELVHARSDLAAAAAMGGGARRWVWDVRSLWADQRIALGALRENGPEARALRAIEGRAARRSTQVITLAAAVIPVLAERHGVDVSTKTHVITTCVDTARFVATPLPQSARVRLQLAGTLNRFYDVPAMVRLTQLAQQRRPTELHVVAPAATPWDRLFSSVGAQRERGTYETMPRLVSSAHAALSLCRMDAGVSLLAAMPTKIGEYLAAGRPVLVNRGLGDADVLLESHQAGVVVDDTSDAGLAQALDRLDVLLDDPRTPARCRLLAEEHFDVERGVDRLVHAYTLAAAS